MGHCLGVNVAVYASGPKVFVKPFSKRFITIAYRTSCLGYSHQVLHAQGRVLWRACVSEEVARPEDPDAL